MSGGKNDLLEVTFRLPSEGLPQLTELLTALLGVVKSGEKETERVENETFDMERFQSLTDEEIPVASVEVSEMEQMTAVELADFHAAETLQPMERNMAEISEIPSPQRRVYDPAGIEAAVVPQPQVAETADNEVASHNIPGASVLSHQWERDARRYDGGFPVY